MLKAIIGAMMRLIYSGLIALTFIDFDTQLLPDDITLPLLWIGLVFNLNTGLLILNQQSWAQWLAI